MFREGPTGRRAVVVDGPDVWEVVRDVRAVRAAEPELSGDDQLALLVDSTGLPVRMLTIAVDYWARLSGRGRLPGQRLRAGGCPAAGRTASRAASFRQVRLLLDEMIGPQVAFSLREKGHDVAAVVERADLHGVPGADVLEAALVEQRCVVTRNIGDFARLASTWRAAGRDHPGLVMVTEYAFPQNRNLVERPRPAEIRYLSP